MQVIDQEVINDNKEIYARIQSELIKARFEILIATAWFTDEELFNTLLRKLAEGIHVELVVADNQDNEKLDFNLLAEKGAAVYKIKNSGYGTMNQKYCVIDKRLALHGSYNWTVNAKKNNQESIISTDHHETVLSLIENFNVTKTRILHDFTKRETTPQPERPAGIPVAIPVKVGSEFEKLLDSMIAAEVGNFDRKLLREQGFDRCAANNGDHQVLHKSFDTLYSVFINDIDVIDDKKKRLIAKIEEHRVKNLELLTKNSELQIDFLQRDNELNKTKCTSKQTDTEAEIDTTLKTIAEIQNVKIPAFDEINENYNQQIKIAERDFIIPKFKWFDFIPVVIFNASLLVYLFLFYSSAAYILLYGVADAKEAELRGIPVAAAQIFNPEAINRAMHKGGTAPYFIFLFVFIPLAFAVIDRFASGKWVPYFGFVFGIILLDGFVAFKVTEAVYEVNYARGNVNDAWQARMAITDLNFYMVFMFGAFGLLLFKLAFKKLMHIFEDRNPDILAQRNQLLIKQIRESIDINLGKIMALKEEVTNHEKQIIHLKAELNHLSKELADLPVILNRELDKVNRQLIADCNNLDQIAAIYTLHIQSDNLPISVDALKDRINVFLEGWNDCLYKEYAVARAAVKTAQATEAALTWQAEKLQTNKIDKRVKTNAGE